MHLKTAVIQLNSRDNPVENLSKVELFLDQAADMGAEFVSLPEFWSYLGPYSGFDEAAQTIPGPFIERLQEKARRYHMIVHGGSIVEPHPQLPGKFYNTTAIINREGEIAACYRKIHLFDVNLANGEKHYESDRIVPGNEVVQVMARLRVSGWFELEVGRPVEEPVLDLRRLGRVEGLGRASGAERPAEHE